MLPSRYPAAVLEAPHRLVIRDVPVWDLSAFADDDLMLIEVAACGVCGSDFRYFAGENPWAQHTLGRFVPNPPNIVLGHEYVGTVVAVASEWNAHWLGKAVAPICSKVCGGCVDCRAGREHLCPETVHMGHGQGWGEREFYPGAYGRYSLAWGRECFEVPPGVTMPEAAMMDILAVCVHVARRGRVAPDRPVLCIGAGPAGNGVAQAARAMGASQVVLLDVSPPALEVARRQGLGEILDVTNLPADEQETLARRFAPEGYGSVFDSVGTAETFALGLRLLGKGGTLVNLAVHDEPLPFNCLHLGSERQITTSCNFEREDFDTALRWLGEGRFRVGEWLTPISLGDLPDCFARAAHGEKTAFKWVVTEF